MAERRYEGLLAIGDPHLASRTPGFRKDDYPETTLAKLAFCLDYARTNRLLPMLLGDLFHWPRDNSNWLLTRLTGLFAGLEVIAIVGNHDCSADSLGDDDSLSVLEGAGLIRFVSAANPWRGAINRTRIAIGGTHWGEKLPEFFDRGDAQIVFWMTHHDIAFVRVDIPGAIPPRPIEGIDLVLNGHLHEPYPPTMAGRTTWLNPGNIVRIKRTDATRTRAPAAVRLDIANGKWKLDWINVPHRPFDEVFHAEVEETAPLSTPDSLFVRGLEALESLKTHDGSMLMKFLEENLPQFDPRVAEEIRFLAAQVIPDAERAPE